MNMNHISVVIPAYNASATIERAIHSVLVQTIAVDEIIVIDDGSLDRTSEFVRQLASESNLCIKLIQQANANAASARNHGIAVSRYDWIAFLDADDYWEPDKIQRQLNVLQRYPNVSVLGGSYFTEIPQCNRTRKQICRTDLCDRPLRVSGSTAFLLGTMLWTGTVIVRRSVLQREPFVSGLEPAEDRDLWVRLAQTETVFLDSQPLATAVLEPNSISRSNIANDCTKMLHVIERNRSMLSISNQLLWKSYVRYRWAAIDPTPSTALPLLCWSFIGWPLPYWSMPDMKTLGRLKRFAYLVWQSFLRRPATVRVSS